MKKLIALFSIITILSFSCSIIVSAQAPAKAATAATADTLSDDALNETGVADTATVKTPTAQDTGIHQSLKRKFIEGKQAVLSSLINPSNEINMAIYSPLHSERGWG